MNIDRSLVEKIDNFKSSAAFFCNNKIFPESS